MISFRLKLLVVSAQTEPADFDAFWTKHLAELSVIPSRIVKTRVPEAFTEEVEVFNVSYQTWGYNDETCPVTRLFAAYNVITAPKELWLPLNMGHPSILEFNARYRGRILARLNQITRAADTWALTRKPIRTADASPHQASLP